jgi:hypothetical protein
MLYLVKIKLITGKIVLLIVKNTKNILSNLPAGMYENIEEIKVKPLADLANKNFVGLGIFQTELNGLTEEDLFV